MRNKIFRTFSFIAYFAVGAFSTNASAAPFVIDFGTGQQGSVGTIIDDGSGIIEGTGITIGVLDVVGTDTMDGQYIADAWLNFNATGGVTVNGVTTGTGGTIEIVGFVSGLSLGLNNPGSPVTLLTGTFDSWSFQNNGYAAIFDGFGSDTKDDLLLEDLGIPLDTQFEFFGFSIGYDINLDGIATAISTDVINTSVVPVPAAVWLFGSGLLGLVGVARRRA